MRSGPRGTRCLKSLRNRVHPAASSGVRECLTRESGDPLGMVLFPPPPPRDPASFHPSPPPLSRDISTILRPSAFVPPRGDGGGVNKVSEDPIPPILSLPPPSVATFCRLGNKLPMGSEHEGAKGVVSVWTTISLSTQSTHTQAECIYSPTHTHTQAINAS